MTKEEDKTLIDILEELPSESKSEEDNTKFNQDFMNPEEEVKSDEKLKPKIINSQSNKNEDNKNNGFSFENFMTEYETKEKDKKYLILSLFFNSVIDMLNSIIIEYENNQNIKIKKLSYLNIETLLEKIPLYLIRLQRLFEIIKLACPENEEIIYLVLDKERQYKKTSFETLINLEFQELYENFIQNCKIVTYGKYIYYLGSFKTLDDVIKENSSMTKKEIEGFKDLGKMDNMEIETINLDNSVFG